jgi:hypothetical protein
MIPDSTLVGNLAKSSFGFMGVLVEEERFLIGIGRWYMYSGRQLEAESVVPMLGLLPQEDLIGGEFIVSRDWSDATVEAEILESCRGWLMLGFGLGIASRLFLGSARGVSRTVYVGRGKSSGEKGTWFVFGDSTIVLVFARNALMAVSWAVDRSFGEPNIVGCTGRTETVVSFIVVSSLSWVLECLSFPFLITGGGPAEALFDRSLLAPGRLIEQQWMLALGDASKKSKMFCFGKKKESLMLGEKRREQKKAVVSWNRITPFLLLGE